MEMVVKGKFITLEGSEGSGKSTQANLICEYLKQRRIPVLFVREPGGVKVSESIRAVFYSNWKYSAVRQLTAIPGYSSIDKIAEALQLSLRTSKDVMDFLVTHGLCVEKKGKFQIGPSATHLEASSPWTYVNHLNWRQKAMEEYRTENRSTLHYM